MPTPVLVALAYLIGSLPFAVIVSRAFGLADPRSFGSGNPGATNVLRSGNKLAALLTLLGDGAKGWLAVWAARALNVDAADVGWVALAVFCGHVFSVFLRFKGGKGVATAAGVMLGLNPWLGLSALAAWLAVAVTTRYSSLAAIVAALAAPAIGWFMLDARSQAIALAAIAVIVVWRHQSNIAKLLAGQESRIGARKG